MSPHRRVALHRDALAALAARGGDNPDFARFAHHAEAAGDGEGVLRWAPRAAERAASSGAHREAAAQYARALRFADGCSLQTRAELLQRRADECYMTDQFAEAIEAQEGALECYRRLGDLRGEGDSLRSLSRLLRYVGRTADGKAAALEAVELLEQIPPGHERAIAYSTVSHLCMAMEDRDGTHIWGTRALELARRLDDPEARVYALTNIGAVDFLAGAPDGRATLERALALAQQHGLEEHTGRAFLNLVVWPIRHRMLAFAAGHLEAGREYCVERGLDTWRLYLHACRARLELDLGHWNDAADAAGLVLRDPRSAPVPRVWALAALGVVRARRGDPDASGALSEAHALAEPTGELQRIGPVAAARAEAALVGRRERDRRGGDRRRTRPRDALSIALDRGRARLLALAGRPPRRAPRWAGRGALPPLDGRRMGTRRADLEADRLSIRVSARAGGKQRSTDRAPVDRRATTVGRVTRGRDRRPATARARRARRAARASSTDA